MVDDRVRLAVLFALAIITTALLSVLVASRAAPVDESRAHRDATMLECLASVIESAKPDARDLLLRNQAVDFCYRLYHGIGLLKDFDIRRLKFFQQSHDAIVMLWMVVAITVSGVILAGVQLAASYKLAAAAGLATFNQSHDITIEQNKLVFKSSVTGLAILVISFAFFLVFVLEIHTIREIKVDPPPQTASGASPTRGTGYQ